MNLSKRKQPRRSTVLLFAFILLLVGTFVLSYNYLVSKKEKVYSRMNLLLYEDEMPEQINDDSNDENNLDNNNDIKTDDDKNKVISYNYIGTLEIKKIKLKRGFLNLDSPYNNVNQNITMIYPSLLPNEKKGNLIFAAHSGDCAYCYFDKLYKLELGDKAVITYKNKKYKYKLVDIYNVAKTGKVEIKRNPEKTVLTLITCTRNSDTEQTVYIFELYK